jgi:hypothetical protein
VFENHFPKVYKIVGSQHYVPVVLEILGFGKALVLK